MQFNDLDVFGANGGLFVNFRGRASCHVGAHYPKHVIERSVTVGGHRLAGHFNQPLEHVPCSIVR